jgi:flagellar protein FliJ
MPHNSAQGPKETALVRKSLIRLKRFRVEELKGRLAALDEMKGGLDENIRQLDSAMEREKIRSGDSAITRLAMPNIIKGIEVRRSNIEKTRADLERDRNALQAELTTAVQELEAAEVAEEQRRRRAVESAASMAEFRRDQQLMRRHLRRHAVR